MVQNEKKVILTDLTCPYLSSHPEKKLAMITME
jgi:hypothetical protein